MWASVISGLIASTVECQDIVNSKSQKSRWSRGGGSNTCPGQLHKERPAYALSPWPGLTTPPGNMA